MTLCQRWWCHRGRCDQEQACLPIALFLPGEPVACFSRGGLETLVGGDGLPGGWTERFGVVEGGVQCADAVQDVEHRLPGARGMELACFDVQVGDRESAAGLRQQCISILVRAIQRDDRLEQLHGFGPRLGLERLAAGGVQLGQRCLGWRGSDTRASTATMVRSTEAVPINGSRAARISAAVWKRSIGRLSSAR